jgi:plastocyanin
MPAFIHQKEGRWRYAALAVLFAAALSGASQQAYAGAKPKVHTIAIEAMQFSPPAAEVAMGDTVIWINKDPFPHTATAQDRSFDSHNIAANGRWKFKVKKKGVFPYVCTLHPTMKGTLTVK